MLTVASSGLVSTVSGRATVSGTVTCTKPVTIGLDGSIAQIVRKVIVSGAFGAQVTCTPGAPAGWTVTVAPSGTTPFQKGDAQVDVRASAFDGDFGQLVRASASSVTSFRKA